MLEVPGNKDFLQFGDEKTGAAPIACASISQIDQDYQMIDAHIDEGIRKKIQAFEFIDFGKLLSKNCPMRDEEGQRLEIVNKNGMSFLSPVGDRESITINHYGKWEQAFRVYSNILTSKYPGKSTELLQYNHTIHTASMLYIWENVYAYDKEFRQHIARHPSRPWGIILQQAWTMLLKDRLKHNSFGNIGPGSSGGKNKRSGEICKCFNKGRCMFGLSCRYEHRCSVPKCRKYGHGAHICRLRNQSMESGDKETSSSMDVSTNSKN